MRKRSYNNLFKGKNLRMGDVKQHNTHTERERERERHKEYNSINKSMQQLQMNNNNLTKGYKVTLYSDSLRATALCANYTNGPNLGTQRG